MRGGDNHRFIFPPFSLPSVLLGVGVWFLLRVKERKEEKKWSRIYIISEEKKLALN